MIKKIVSGLILFFLILFSIYSLNSNFFKFCDKSSILNNTEICEDFVRPNYEPNKIDRYS